VKRLRQQDPEPYEVPEEHHPNPVFHHMPVPVDACIGCGRAMNAISSNPSHYHCDPCLQSLYEDQFETREPE
jgi:hypothetical protein